MSTTPPPAAEQPDDDPPPLLSFMDSMRGLQEAFGPHDSEEEGYALRIPWWVIAALLGGAALTAVLLYLLLRYLVQSVWSIHWDAFYGYLGVWPGRVVGAVVLVLVGIGFYLFRRYLRAGYGLFEVGVASVGGWVALGTFADDKRMHLPGGVLTAWFGTFAAIYVVVRGVDNFMEGLKVQKKERDASADEP